MKKQTQKTAAASFQAHPDARPLVITLTLTGEQSHAYRAMCVRDNKSPGEHLAETNVESIRCYMEARASDLGKGAAMAGAISGRESEVRG